MKAWSVTQLGAPAEVLQQVDRELAAPGPGELTIEVAAAALGLPDVLMCRGNYEYKPELPFTPGQEVAGTVLAVGEGVSVSPGQRVMGVTAFFAGNGGFAQQCASREGMVYPVPDGMPDTVAAAFSIAYQTAWAGLVSRGRLQPGETLLVLGGAGGSGSAAIQLGKALGARVIAVAGGAGKVEQCREFGADAVVDHRAADFVEAVNGLTESRGADVVFDPVGRDTGSRAVGCIAREGRLLAIGFASGRWCEPSTRELVFRNAANLGVFVGAYSPAQRLTMHEELVKLYRNGLIAPPVAHPLDFAAIPRALAALERREVKGKLVAWIN